MKPSSLAQHARGSLHTKCKGNTCLSATHQRSQLTCECPAETWCTHAPSVSCRYENVSRVFWRGYEERLREFHVVCCVMYTFDLIHGIREIPCGFQDLAQSKSVQTQWVLSVFKFVRVPAAKILTPDCEIMVIYHWCWDDFWQHTILVPG